MAILSGAAAAQDPPTLSIAGGMGMPGGTVAAVAALAGDTQAAGVAADLTISFPADSLIFDPGNCALAARLDGTHVLSGGAPTAGEVRLAITPIGPSPAGLADGPLAVCDIGIRLGAVAGTAALDLSGMLMDRDGNLIPSESLDGAIRIVSGEPTATATNTATPTITPTVTETPPATFTQTPSQTPTASPFQPTVLFDRFGSDCAVTGRGDYTAWPILGVVVLVVWRRRLR